MKILTLNCQKAYQPGFEDFFKRVLNEDYYDFLILQEVNNKVGVIFKETNSSYKILNQFDPDIGEESHVCIIYKCNFVLKGRLFHSFAKFIPKMSPRGWGFITGVFMADNSPVVISSIHLHPGIKSSTRMKEVRIIKEKMQKYSDKEYPVILAGDFNSGFPGEISKAEATLAPQFVRINKNLGPTLDSRYTEKSPFFITKVANFLAALGISIKFRADHIYVNESLAEAESVSCKLLLDRVSDHYPIEVTII